MCKMISNQRYIRNTKYYCRISLFIRVDSNLFLIANGAWLPTVANEELLLLSAAPTNMPMHEGFTFKMYNEKREYNCNGKYEASITIIIIYELYTQIPIFHPQLKNVHKNLNKNFQSGLVSPCGGQRESFCFVRQ